MPDGLDILDPVRTMSATHAGLPAGVVAEELPDPLYHPDHGIRMLHRASGVSGYTDLIRFSDGFFMVVSDTRMQEDVTASYVASGWVAFHYRLSGRSSMLLADGEVMGKEASCCHVSCYPTDFVRTERGYRHEDGFRYVAVLLRPWTLAQDFQTCRHSLPTPLQDHLEARLDRYWQGSLPLTRDVQRCLQQIMESGFTRELRWHFLHGKALELLCRTIAQLADADMPSAEPTDIRIRPRDIDRLHQAKDLIASHPEQRFSIPSISRQVGLNRRKLTYGFSKLFGQTIFEFGQQIRMDRAVKMLREDRLNIGQIAGLLGYENPRNFSVAFVNRFGVLPKDARARLRMGGDIGATLAGEIDMTCGNRDFS